jgi:RNA polymerase sigma-70 factor (ECF subfamily)
MTDAELIARFKDGDGAAFEALLSRHKDPLYSFLVAMVKDEAAASDIFQETCIKVFRNLENYSEEGKFKPWLFRMASNLAMDHFRRNAALPRFEQVEDFCGDDEHPARETTAQGEEPGEILLSETDKALVAAALDALPPEQKEVVLLREYSGLSFKEVAEITNAPLGTVLARMSRAVKKLRKSLEKTYERS